MHRQSRDTVRKPARFLHLAWFKQVLDNYREARPPARLKGRVITLSPRQYGAALLMSYLGEFSLPTLAQVAGVDLDTLMEWRESPEFLLIMDWSKSRFAEVFQENLVLEDFPPQEYLDIAGEFACLEESLRIRVRTGLYPQLRDLGEQLLSRYHHGLPLETSSFPKFRRLFLFFWALEAFWPSTARPRLQEKLLPLAREVVWPTLGLAEGEELSQEMWGDIEYGLRLKESLGKEMRRAFQSLPLSD